MENSSTNAATEENYYDIEHPDEELPISSPVVVQQADDDGSADDGSHSVIQREFENGKGTYFFCTTCDKSYLNIEDYIESHETDAKSEELAIFDLIEYDASEDVESNTLEYETATEVKEKINDTDSVDVAETGVDKYFCYDCRTVFKELEDAEQHDCPGIKQVTSKAIESSTEIVLEEESLLEFMCAFCEINFKDLAALEQHQTQCYSYTKKPIAVTAHQEKYVCNICHMMFSSLKALNSHSRGHHSKDESSQKPETTCRICNITFATNSRLKLHMKIHAEQPLRSIQQALPEVAKKEYNRLNHFFCEICNKSFDQNLLAVHKDMHQNVEKYVCDLCNRDFDNAQSYEVHQQKHKMKLGDSSIRNGPTEAMLRNAKNGIKSIHVSSAKQTYPCQYCGHVFWRPFEKTRHERVHTGEKPYACEICGKRFRVPYSLTLHLRTHADVRPYVCATCNKRFKSQSVYTHHLRTHLNNRAYSCNLCSKSFRTSVQLNAHQNSHTKPFNCTICNRPFASLHSVKLHMKSHDKNSVPESSQHRCELCGAVYVRTAFLRAHLRDHHGVELTSVANINENIVAEESAEESEADAVAALLITAAADAEAREEQRHRIETQFSNFNKCESIQNEEDILAVDQEYLRNELILDSFDTEETVTTGF